MSERETPPFRADHVGSLLRPPELLKARKALTAGHASPADLRQAEDVAISEAVRRQEEIGLATATDGEFRRTMFHKDFLEKFDNVEIVDANVTSRFQSGKGEDELRPFAFHIVGKLTRSKPIFVDDFKYLKSVAKVTPKLTLPSPSMIHFRGGRKAIDEKIYPDIAEFYSDLARGFAAELTDLGAAGCTYIQLDEVNLAYLCDPKLGEQARKVGEDPTTLPRTYARLINDSIAGRPKDLTVCLHLCRGNHKSAWVAEGGYDPVAELLFNDIKVDGYFLEYDDQRSGGFAPLRFVPKGKMVVLGLVTSKFPTLESKDELKRRIDEASKYVPLEYLAISPQCGFASTLVGNLLSAEEQYAKLRHVVEVAREVWG